MAKQPATMTIRKVREQKFERFSGCRCAYGETKRSLIVATFDMWDGGRCDSVYIVHKVSANRVLNPYMNDDWTPVHDRQRRCKRAAIRKNCDRNGEVKDIRDRLENE